MDKGRFYKIAEANKPKEPIIKHLFASFFMGGTIGIINQGLLDLGRNYCGFTNAQASLFSGMLIVGLVAILTKLSLYGKLGQIFGAGLFIPLTGFANSMVASSIEGKSEGLILGIGNKTFSLAGSVIVYGICSAIIISLIRFILLQFGVNL